MDVKINILINEYNFYTSNSSFIDLFEKIGFDCVIFGALLYPNSSQCVQILLVETQNYSQKLQMKVPIWWPTALVTPWLPSVLSVLSVSERILLLTGAEQELSSTIANQCDL